MAHQAYYLGPDGPEYMSCHRLLPTALTALLLGGCFPWVSVPSRVEVSGMRASVSPPPDSPSGSGTVGGFRFRGAVCPLGAVNSLHGREFDLGFGYLYDSYATFGQDSLEHHGFFAEGAYFLFRSDDDGPIWRLATIVSAEGLVSSFRGDARTGPGISAGLLWEYTNVASGFGIAGAGDIGAIGGAYGEWGWGLSLTGSYAHLDGRDYSAILFGLSLRLPFGAGVVILSH
jgi:hypothetical protein